MNPDWWSLNIRHLRALSAVVTSGSLSGASARIHLSQPALTQGIAKLEHLLGAQLFERHSVGMTATEAGRLLAGRADAAFQSLHVAFDAAGIARNRGSEAKVTSVQLRAFLSFAAAGSFAGAAAETGVAQATLHRAVGDLERLTGLGLYRRAGRGVQLSAEGRAVARGMRRAIAEIEAGLSEVEHLAGREIGVIRIGAMPLSRAAIVPEAIARFRRTRPGIGVEVVDGAYADLMERLKDGEVDFLIGALRGRQADPAVAEESLLDDRLSIVAGPDHPLVGADRIDAAQLAAFPWIVARQDTPHYRHWRRIFENEGVKVPANPVICSSVIAIRELLALDDFLALLSYDQVQRPVGVGHLVLLGPPVEATRRPIGLTTLAGFRPTPFQLEMLALVRTIARERNSGN
jgi:LysR family transcriptional regulator of gallate degradation